MNPLSHLPLQFVGTFVLVFVVFAVSDRRNSGLHPSLIPLAIFIVILGVGAAFGMQTGTYRVTDNKRVPIRLLPSIQTDAVSHAQATPSTPPVTLDRAS